nr:unnamed protein product [Callosobruchus chinensis]
MSSDLYVDPVSILDPNILLLKFLGFWKDTESSSVYNQLWYKVYRSFVVFSQAAFFFTEINLVLYIYVVVPLNLYMTVVSYLNIGMIHLIQNLKSERYHPKSPDEDAFVRGWKTVALRFQKSLVYSNWFLVVSGAFLALLKGERTMFVAHVPSFLNWKVFFGSQVLMSVYTGHMTANYAIVLITVQIELLIQVYLLKNALVQVSNLSELKTCIDWHLLLLSLRKKIQRFCSMGMSLVFLMGVIIMCTTMSVLTQGENADVAFLFPYVSVMVVILLGNCWCGSEVMSQSDEISYSIYSSDWTSSSLSYMKLMKTQLLFTKNPMELYLGGGVTTISLPVFVTIMKTTYTVFTILQGFEDEA